MGQHICAEWQMLCYLLPRFLSGYNGKY